MTTTNYNNIKVSVDTEWCISCWACVAICEEIFEFQKWKSIAKKQPENDNEIKMSIEAAWACPVSVIKVDQIKAANDNEPIKIAA